MRTIEEALKQRKEEIAEQERLRALEKAREEARILEQKELVRDHLVRWIARKYEVDIKPLPIHIYIDSSGLFTATIEYKGSINLVNYIEFTKPDSIGIIDHNSGYYWKAIQDNETGLYTEFRDLIDALVYLDDNYD